MAAEEEFPEFTDEELGSAAPAVVEPLQLEDPGLAAAQPFEDPETLLGSGVGEVVQSPEAAQLESDFPEFTDEELGGQVAPPPVPAPVLEAGPEEFPEFTDEELDLPKQPVEADLPPLQGVVTGYSPSGEIINRTSLENFQDVLTPKTTTETLPVGPRLRQVTTTQSSEESFKDLAGRAFGAPSIPEDALDSFTPIMINAFMKQGVIDYDQDTDSYWWLQHPDRDNQSLANPVRIEPDALRDIARRMGGNKYLSDRERSRRIVREAKDPQKRAMALYEFMKEYYPSVAREAAKTHPFLKEYDFEGLNEPWYSSLMGVLNVLDMTLGAGPRKGFLELRNEAQKERVVEGQFELPGGLESDYVATNGIYRMANGNYLVPVAGRGVASDPEATPDAWPEDLVPKIVANAPMGDWPEGMEGLDSVAIRKAGVPDRTTINGVQYWVTDQQQFRGMLMDDLHDHVSLSGKLAAPMRWAGVHRGFSETDVGEAWRRLGLRRFMRGGVDKKGNPYLTGEHFPGFRNTVKVEGGIEKEAPFVEDLAKVFSSVGGRTGTMVSDEIAHEAGKDIAAIGSLPYRGIQGIWNMRDEAMTDMAELVFPKGSREAAGEHDPGLLNPPGWATATQALAEILTPAATGAGVSEEPWIGVPGVGAVMSAVGLNPPVMAAEGGQFPHDPEAGIDPLGNLTFELASSFLDPLLAPGVRVLPKVERMGGTTWHSPAGPLTETGEKSLRQMLDARLREAAGGASRAEESILAGTEFDFLAGAVPYQHLSVAEQLGARRKALSDFSKVHSEARKAGETVVDVGYETRNVLDDAGNVIGTELAVAKTLSPETGVAMKGGIVPWTTSPRTQPMVNRAVKDQLSGLADEVLGVDTRRRAAVDGMIRGVGSTVRSVGSLTDRLLGTDWIRKGGGAPIEAWALTRAALEDFGFAQQEIVEFTKKFFAQGPDLVGLTADDLVMTMHILETNKDIVLDERLLRAGADIREFIDASRALETEVARGRFKVLVEDPAVQEMVERLHVARWRQKYNEIAYKLKHGSERTEAVQGVVLGLEKDLEVLHYTMGRMERLAEIRGLEDEFAEHIEASERLIALALGREKAIPPRFGGRATVPDEFTSPQTAEHLEDVAADALDEIRRLEEEVEGLRRNLITEHAHELKEAGATAGLPSALAKAPVDVKEMGKVRKSQREGTKRVYKEKRKKLETKLASLEKERDALVKSLDETLQLPEFPTPAEYWTLTGEKGTKPSRLSWEKGKGAPAPEAAAEVGGPVYYRGTRPGGERSVSGDRFWDEEVLFAADTREGAAWYAGSGGDVEQITFKPGSRILKEGTKEFASVAGRWRKGENLLEFASRAAQAAKNAGYDAVHFKRQTDVGTAILNESAVVRSSPVKTTFTGETRASGNLVAHKAKGAKTWTLSHAGGEEVATGFKTAQDAQSWGEAVATYHPKLAAAAAGDFARVATLAEHAESPLLNLAASYSKKGKMLKPWDPKGAWSRMGPVAATMDWAERARKAVAAGRRTGNLRNTIKTQKDKISALDTELGERLSRTSPYQDVLTHNAAIEKEVSRLEKRVAGLDKTSRRAEREASSVRVKIDKERYGVQAMARSELRRQRKGEVRELRKMARDARVGATKKRDELRELLKEIRGKAKEIARARAAKTAINEFNDAAAKSLSLKKAVKDGKMSEAEAEASLKELLFPEDPKAMQWAYTGKQKPKLSKKQQRLPKEKRAEILADSKGRDVSGVVRAASREDANKILAGKNIEVASLESGKRTKLTQEIDDLQANISERLGIEEKVDILKMLNLTEDATPYEIVKKVLQHQDEAFKMDVDLARMIPGYNPKMDDILGRLEGMTERERFMIADHLKMQGRGGRYAGLSAEEEHLRPVVEHIRKYFDEMLNTLQDHGILTDWKLYDFLDRANVSGFVHHMLSTAGFGLSGRSRSLTRQAASRGRILQETTSPLMFRGIGGAASEIDDMMKWIVGEQIVKHQARLGMIKEYTLEMVQANVKVPHHLIEDAIKYFPDEFRYFEQNVLLGASHYSGQIAKAIGGRRLWDDLEMVGATFFPEAKRFNAMINDPKIVLKAARESVGPGEEVVKRVGLDTLDRIASETLEGIYGVPFKRVTGASSAALLSGGKFPTGDTAILDALDVMVRNGADAKDVSKWLEKRHGIQITAKEAETMVRGHVYFPEALADFVMAQLGHSSLGQAIQKVSNTPGFAETGRLALDVYDTMNNLFKGYVTIVWPRFHGRNQWGGMIQNAMIHGEISVRPEFQQRVIFAMSKEGRDIPITFGDVTMTGREWDDVMMKLHVYSDQGAVADLEKLAAGHPIAGMQGPISGQVKAWAARTVEKIKTGSKTEVFDEFIDFLYKEATLKDLRGAYRAEQAALPPIFGGTKGQVGRLKTGPAGQAITSTLATGLTAGAVGMVGGGPLIAAPAALVGSGLGFLQALASQKAFRLGGEIARVGENHLRATNFLAGIQRGHSAEEAAWFVNKAHFNYNPQGQSWFGYQVMRRINPFWTWNSKNFKQHLWLMQNRPVEMATLNKIMTGMMHHETSPELEAILPPQLKSRLRFHMSNGAFFAGLGTPFEAFTEMLRPMSGGGLISGLPGSAGLTGQLNPWLLAVAELVQQEPRSFFFDRPISEIRAVRELREGPQFLQEFFGYDPTYTDKRTGLERHLIGTLDPLKHPDKPWIPDQKEAAKRWYLFKRLDALPMLMNFWYQARAEAYQDPTAQLDPSKVRVSGPERAARMVLSWRTYHLDVSPAEVNKRAYGSLMRKLMEEYQYADPTGVVRVPTSLRKGGAVPTMGNSEADRILQEMMGAPQ